MGNDDLNEEKTFKINYKKTAQCKKDHYGKK